MTISNLSMIINPTKIFLHGRLFEDKTLFNQFKSYIEKDLSFIGDKYFSNIELVTYKPINLSLIHIFLGHKGKINLMLEDDKSKFIIEIPKNLQLGNKLEQV